MNRKIYKKISVFINRSMPDINDHEKRIRELENKMRMLEAMFLTTDHKRPDGKDELYDKAKELTIEFQIAAASFLQRHLNIGYARAAKLIDQLEEEGIIGPFDGPRPRKILVSK